jgi:tropomyosin-2
MQKVSINHRLACLVKVDRLEDELYQEQEKFKAITEELEQTFAEMSGY